MKDCKVPVLALFDKNRPGFLLGIHSDDFLTVVVEFVASRSDDERNYVEQMIGRAQDRSRAKPGPS
jgi:hypothetical protein